MKKENNGIVGKIQLYLASKQKFQVMDGCGADFKTLNGSTIMSINRIQNGQS